MSVVIVDCCEDRELSQDDQLCITTTDQSKILTILNPYCPVREELFIEPDLNLIVTERRPSFAACESCDAISRVCLEDGMISLGRTCSAVGSIAFGDHSQDIRSDSKAMVGCSVLTVSAKVSARYQASVNGTGDGEVVGRERVKELLGPQKDIMMGDDIK